MKKLIAITVICIAGIFSLLAYEKYVGGKVSVEDNIRQTSETKQKDSAQTTEDENEIVKAELEKLYATEFDDIEKAYNTIDETFCGKASDGLIPIRIYEHDYSTFYEDEESNVCVFWQVPRVDASVSGKYEELDNALYENGVQRYKEAKELEIRTKNNCLQNIDYYNYSRTYVMRSDTKVLSILYKNNKINDYYEFFGQVKYESKNYNPETGEEISFSSLVKDKARFIETLNEKLKSEYSDIYDELFCLDAYFNEKTDDEICFTIDNNSVTVYFNAGEIDEIEKGEVIIAIPFDLLGGIIDETFLPFTTSFITPIINYDGYFCADANDDGKRELYHYNKVEDDEDSLLWRISSDDIHFDIDEYNVGAETYLVCDDGKNYLYLFCEDGNDGVSFSAADMAKMKYDNDKYLYFHSEFHEIDSKADESLCEYRYAMIDPANMNITSMTEVFRCNVSFSGYRVGDDGYPVSKKEVFSCDSNKVYELLANLDSDKLDKEGNIVGKEKIKKGSYIVLAYTDNKSYADVVIVDESDVASDGSNSLKNYRNVSQYLSGKTLYRIAYDNSEYYNHTINGEKEEKYIGETAYIE